jgi:hypothetical protein
MLVAGFFLSCSPNRPFPPVLPPNRSVGGGPAGVVVELREKFAGVVEPVGAGEVVPAVGAIPKPAFDSPGPEKKGF